MTVCRTVCELWQASVRSDICGYKKQTQHKFALANARAGKGYKKPALDIELNELVELVSTYLLRNH